MLGLGIVWRISRCFVRSFISNWERCFFRHFLSLKRHFCLYCSTYTSFMYTASATDPLGLLREYRGEVMYSPPRWFDGSLAWDWLPKDVLADCGKQRMPRPFELGHSRTCVTIWTNYSVRGASTWFLMITWINQTFNDEALLLFWQIRYGEERHVMLI